MYLQIYKRLMNRNVTLRRRRNIIKSSCEVQYYYEKKLGKLPINCNLRTQIHRTTLTYVLRHSASRFRCSFTYP